MKRLNKIMTAVLPAVCLLIGRPVPVLAEEASDNSITIVLNDIGTDRGKVKFQAWRIGDVRMDQEDVYVLIDALKETGVDLDSLPTGTNEENRNAAAQLERVIDESGLEALTAVSGSDGKAAFENLPDGVYLIRKTDAAEYGTMDPFLIAVPAFSEGGDMIRNIEAAPKAEPFMEEPPSHEEEPPASSAPPETPDPELPSTGVWNNPLPYAAAAAVSVAILLVLVGRKKIFTEEE